jgi:16S rRNA (guanine966-N2)-methyltransferase
MRIIAGTARGSKLKTLPNEALRPMLDRVKEPMFSILQHVVKDARVLDLFCGSGSLGLEALSRGAADCTFVERSRELIALAQVNAEWTHLADKAQFIESDVLALVVRPPQGEPADLVLADPPYAMMDDPNARARLFASIEALIGGWVAPNAIVVLHHRPLPFAIWPTKRLEQWDQRVYGQSQITFFDVVETTDTDMDTPDR